MNLECLVEKRRGLYLLLEHEHGALGLPFHTKHHETRISATCLQSLEVTYTSVRLERHRLSTSTFPLLGAVFSEQRS